ncbi:MAG: hypothetical protein PWQ08_1276 [Clostridiales bacterium]|nr:hypothetical protein [Clostridiales bacterium]
MAGYHEFAYFYDELNGEADYDTLHQYIVSVFKEEGLPGNIVADLGCGTGELTLRLAGSGYDMIAIDASADMLSVLQNKLMQQPGPKVLLVCQDLTKLDLYGGLHGAVCTFDTLNHIGSFSEMQKVLGRVALFLEQGGIFIFDVNTPYKHTDILADETFVLEDDDAVCVWQNTHEPTKMRTKISIHITAGEEEIEETFYEYYCTPEQLVQACTCAGLAVQSVLDGETFCAPTPETQRLIFVTKKE